MEIVEFGHKQIGTRTGGIEVVVTELASRMPDDSITVIDRRPADGRPTGYAPPGNVTVREVRAPDIKGAAAVSCLNATRLACRLPSDVVHVHAEGQCMFLGRLRRAGRHVTVTVHGLDWRRAKWGRLGRAAIVRGEEMCARYADDIIVLSDDAASYFRDVYGRGDCHVIRNGITVNPTDDDDELARIGVERGGYFLFLGRLAPEKRVDLLVDAYERLGTDRRLVIAGPATDLGDAPWRARAERDPRIVLPGAVSGRALDQLYSGCQAFVLPSDLEGMALSLLEAMGHGATCVASDIPENVSALGGHGMTFPRGDAGALAERLDEADGMPFARDADEMRFVRDRYDWDAVAAATREVLLSCSRR